MRRWILIGIAACFYYSGLVAFARWLRSVCGPCVVILNYHRATGGDLRQHVLYLRRHYHIMHVENALARLAVARTRGTILEDRRSMLALTFDDGYQDNYTHAYKLAREMQIPLTIYLIPGYIESQAPFWWLEGKRLVQHAQVQATTLDGRRYRLDHHADRSALASWIDMRARAAPSVQAREDFLQSVRRLLAIDTRVYCREEVYVSPLTWTQVFEMDASGLVSFGAHTMHHPILAYLVDQAEIQYEVTACKTLLEQRLGHPIRSFAYPVGQKQHMNEVVQKCVQDAGYTWALTTSYGINTATTDRYLLRRIEVDADQHWLVVAAEAAGLWGIFARLRWWSFIRRYFTNSSKKLKGE